VAFRKLIKLEDLKAFRNIMLLAQSDPVRGVLAPMLLQDPGTRTFFMYPGTPIPCHELKGTGPACVVLGFDDANADLTEIGQALLRLQGGEPVRELVVAPVPTRFVPQLALLQQASKKLILCDNFKAGQILEGIPVLTLADYHQQHPKTAETLLIATRDDKLSALFRNGIPSKVVLDLNRGLESRLEAIRQSMGDIPVFDAAWLEGTLGQVFADNDLARVIQFAYRHLTPDSVVFDVGAHSGHTAMLFRQRCERVYAFEPDPEPFASMAERFLEEPSVIPVQAAVGNRAGQATLNLDYRGAVGGSSSLLGHLFTEDLRVNSASVPVELLTLDGFCEELGVTPDFIKIDVEGSEPDVVEGAWGVLSRTRPPLVYEQYSYFAQLRPDDFMNMMDQLSSLYVLECQETGEDPRHRFMKPEMPALTNIACHPRN